MTDFDDRELRALGVDLEDVAQSAPELRAVFRKGASDLKDLWRDNARKTAGDHGRLYPNAITYETHLTAAGVEAEVGPEKDRPQGNMSFEYGSKNQPPHLDGNRAADKVMPLLEQRLAETAEELF